MFVFVISDVLCILIFSMIVPFKTLFVIDGKNTDLVDRIIDMFKKKGNLIKPMFC